jgi:hypothetical protein
MQSKSISRYIFFGTALRFLQDAKEKWPVHGQAWVLANIDSFFAYLKEFELPVTQRAAYNLHHFRDKLAQTDSDHSLTAEEASTLNEITKTLRETLFAEAEGNVAFIVTDKRIDVNKLLSDVPALMAPGIFDLLPDISRYDFIQAGRCIAFELSTAAAFHLLRGTEGVLRQFYCSVVRRNRAELLWGPIVESLRRRSKPPPAPLLDNLDNIRRSFRNPTQHPDKIYDIQEVQDLFGLCVDVVNRMVTLSQMKTTLHK